MAPRPGPSTPLPSGLIDHAKPAPFPFGPTTLADILVDGLAEHPERLALIDGDRAWTWAELDAAVEAAAANIAVGQVVLWTEPNSAELVVALLATFRAGGIWMSTSSQVPESVDVDARMSRISSDRAQGDPFGVALVSFTSGTTGVPKSVAHNEHALLAPGLVSIEVEPPEPGERIGTPLDLRIANIAILGPISALLRGSTFVVMHQRFAAGLASDIAQFGVTRLFAVPTLIFDMVEGHDVAPEQLTSLDRIILGGSGADAAVLSRFADRFGVRPTLSYGLSEAPTGVVRESLDDPIGSGRGFALPHVDIVITDPATGVEVPVGSEGEVCIRPTADGPWANCWTGTLGYLGEPDRTAKLFEGGLLHTGDRGVLDADGALSVTGRLSNLIVRGGKNIDPTELEAAACVAVGVAEAVAVGIPDDRLGQIVGLAVLLDDGLSFHKGDSEGSIDGLDQLDINEIVMDIEEETESSVDATMVVSRWPRNAMGKIDRTALIRAFGPETRM